MFVCSILIFVFIKGEEERYFKKDYFFSHKYIPFIRDFCISCFYVASLPSTRYPYILAVQGLDLSRVHLVRISHNAISTFYSYTVHRFTCIYSYCFALALSLRFSFVLHLLRNIRKYNPIFIETKPVAYSRLLHMVSTLTTLFV